MPSRWKGQPGRLGEPQKLGVGWLATLKFLNMWIFRVHPPDPHRVAHFQHCPPRPRSMPPQPHTRVSPSSVPERSPHHVLSTTPSPSPPHRKWAPEGHASSPGTAGHPVALHASFPIPPATSRAFLRNTLPISPSKKGLWPCCSTWTPSAVRGSSSQPSSGGWHPMAGACGTPLLVQSNRTELTWERRGERGKQLGLALAPRFLSALRRADRSGEPRVRVHDHSRGRQQAGVALLSTQLQQGPISAAGGAQGSRARGEGPVVRALASELGSHSSWWAAPGAGKCGCGCSGDCGTGGRWGGAGAWLLLNSAGAPEKEWSRPEEP